MFRSFAKLLSRQSFSTLSISLPEISWEKIVQPGYAVRCMEERDIPQAAELLTLCFTKIEPAASYKQNAYDDSFEFYMSVLNSVWKEKMTAVMLNDKEEIVGMKVTRNGAHVLRNPPDPPSPHLDPGLRAIQLMRRRNYTIMSEYYRSREWLDKKILHVFLAAVHPKVRGLRVGPIVTSYSCMLAKQQGFERAFVFSGSIFSAANHPPECLIRQDAYDDMVLNDPVKGEIIPFRGVNEWYTNKVNEERIKQGKELLKDVAKYLQFYEGPIERFVEHPLKAFFGDKIIEC